MQRIVSRSSEQYAWSTYPDYLRGPYGLPRIADEVGALREASAQ